MPSLPQKKESLVAWYLSLRNTPDSPLSFSLCPTNLKRPGIAHKRGRNKTSPPPLFRQGWHFSLFWGRLGNSMPLSHTTAFYFRWLLFISFSKWVASGIYGNLSAGDPRKMSPSSSPLDSYANEAVSPERKSKNKRTEISFLLRAGNGRLTIDITN